MGKREVDDYLDWSNIEQELKRAIEMLNARYYGLLDTQMDALLCIVRNHRIEACERMKSKT